MNIIVATFLDLLDGPLEVRFLDPTLKWPQSNNSNLGLQEQHSC
jgi:hypothetical protein